MSTTSTRSPSSPRDGDARTLAESLGMTAPAGAILPEPLRPDPTSAGHLRLDKCGALEGQPKLKPVRAYARPGPPRDFTPGGRQVADVVTSKVTAKSGGSKPKKATLPPKIGSLRPAEMDALRSDAAPSATPSNGFVPAAAPAGETEEVRIPAGTFLFGEEREARVLPSFGIDRYPVTHGDYESFVRATGHRAPLYWPGGSCPDDLRTHPVVGVDYFDALAFAKWKGKDLPFEDEWERAARGVDGRSYPWGNDPDVQVANTARSGIKMTVPVGFHAQNASPEGVRDLVGNTWEFTHSSAPGGGVVVRGGSWYDFALYAKSYFRFAARTDARNGTIGFRCVRRDAERADQPREVDELTAEEEIRRRRTAEAPPDVSRFSAERRDLVPDYRRLKILVGENAAVRASASTAATSPAPAAPPPPAPAAPPKTERTAGVNAAFDAFGAATAAKPATPAEKPAEPALPSIYASVSRVPLRKPPPERPPETRPPERPAEVRPPPAPSASESRAAPAAAAAPPPPRATPAHGTPVKSTAPVAPSEPLHVGGPAPSRPPPPPSPSSTAGFDRVGLQKATESAVSSRRAAPAPGHVEPATTTPLLWWGLLGGGVVLCLVLLITLISNLMKDGGSTDEGDEGTEVSIERHPGDGTEEMPAEGTSETPSETPAEPQPADPTAKPPPDETLPPAPRAPHEVTPPPVAPRLPEPPAEAPPPVAPTPEETTPVEVPPPPAEELRVPGLPDAVASPGDAKPPAFLDGAAGPWDAKLKQGVWLLLFAPTPETAAASTVKAANSLHRRFRNTQVRVLLVVPRADFQDSSGELLAPADVQKKLVSYGATSDVQVLLDPATGMLHGSVARNKWGIRRPTTALVLQRGREEGRTYPPGTDKAFTLLTLAEIAVKALARTSSAVPGR